MASVKKLIDSTIGSYRSSHKSVPNNSGVIDVAIGTVYGVDYIPPSDGWLLLTGNAKICHLITKNTGLQVLSTPNESISTWCATFLRVNKGETYTAWAHDSSNATLLFFPDIGS